MRTYFYIIRHALKPKHKIHVWTFYIPMYQCALHTVQCATADFENQEQPVAQNVQTDLN